MAYYIGKDRVDEVLSYLDYREKVARRLWPLTSSHVGQKTKVIVS